MKDSLKLKGYIYQIDDEIVVSPKFKKREFIIKIEKKVKEWEFIEHIKFQLSQHKCEMMDLYRVDEYVEVEFYIKGKKYTKKESGQTMFFVTLETYNVNPLAKVKRKTNNIKEFDNGQEELPMGSPIETSELEPEDPIDDLPF